MTQTKKLAGQTADVRPSHFVYAPPKYAPEDEPMVMNMFLSSATPDGASNSDEAPSSNSAPRTPPSTPIDGAPFKNLAFGEGNQQFVAQDSNSKAYPTPFHTPNTLAGRMGRVMDCFRMECCLDAFPL
ncbi:hypothetical protein MferCBS49748_006204 [Microsporum ferrugineum]